MSKSTKKRINCFLTALKDINPKGYDWNAWDNHKKILSMKKEGFESAVNNEGGVSGWKPLPLFDKD